MRCLRYLSVESILKDKVKIIRQVLRIIISLKIVSELFKATENAENSWLIHKYIRLNVND